jgi:hypothetical protein
MRPWPIVALFVLFLNFTHAQPFGSQQSNIVKRSEKAFVFELELLADSANWQFYIGDSIYFPTKSDLLTYPYNLANDFLYTQTKEGVRVKDLSHNLANKANEDMYYQFSEIEQSMMQLADSQISFAYRPTALFNTHFYRYDVFTAYASVQNEWFTLVAIRDSLIAATDSHFLLIKLRAADGSEFVWTVSSYQLGYYPVFLGSEMDSLIHQFVGKPIYLDTLVLPKFYNELDKQFCRTQLFHAAQCTGIVFINRPNSAYTTPALKLQNQLGQQALLYLNPIIDYDCPRLQWKHIVVAPQKVVMPACEAICSSLVRYGVKTKPKQLNPLYVRKYGKSIANNIMLHRVVLGMSATTCALSWGKPLYKTFVTEMGIETQIWRYSDNEWLSFKEGVLVGFKARQ